MAKDRGTQIRISQPLTTWGPGAIIPLPNNISGIVCGIDNWNNDDPKFKINDKRLVRRLKIEELRNPPYFTDEDPRKVPYFVFPTIYYCTKCGHVQKMNPDLPNFDPKCERERCFGHLVPERFIVISSDGDIDDIPVIQLLLGEDAERWLNDSEFRKKNPIVRNNHSATSALSGISYKCEAKGTRFNMAELFQGSNPDYSLERAYGNYCPGTQPWLARKREGGTPLKTDTRKNVQIVQAGGTNVWIPKIVSSIFIPKEVTYTEDEKGFLEDFQKKSLLRDLLSNGSLPSIAKRYKLSVDTIQKLVKDLEEGDEPDKDVTEEEYRFEEYKKLSSGFGSDSSELYAISQDTSKYDPFIRKYFSRISLVKRIKETRALVGFYRGESDSMLDDETLKARLSREKTKWLPAVQVMGEGVFLTFNQETINEWVQENDFIRKRAKKLNDHVASLSSHPLEITPKYLLIHTFAHILINEMSKECGYGSSSLRERIYCSDSEDTPMCGFLIYTTSGSSEGSLGGLVREGSHGYLEPMIQNALAKAGWCSSDPVCIESEGQGNDSCNLAACYSCVLLPETSCEVNNKFLDRVMLIGKPTDQKLQKTGFFSELMNDDGGDL